MSLRPFHKLPGSPALTGGPVVANGAVSASVIKYNLAAALNPAVTDDSSAGYGLGSVWVNTANNTVWLCSKNGVGIAVWKQVGGNSSSNIVGYNAVVLTNTDIAIQVGVSKNNQAFSGALSGPVVINVSRTGATEGDEIFIALNSPAITPAFTLNIQENGAGSLSLWNGTETLNGLVWLVYTGTAWTIKSLAVVSS